MLIQVSKLLNLVKEYKAIFLGKQIKLWNFKKVAIDFGVNYKVVLQSVKSLNWRF